MSQEREFIETILNQRFNYLIVFFSIVIAGAFSTENQFHLQLILTIGAVFSYLFYMTLQRSRVKLDLLLNELKSDEYHPVRIIDDKANTAERKRDFFERIGLSHLSMRHIIDT